MSPLEAERMRFPAADPASPCGARTFAAYDREDLLAAALVGWAAGRVYYLIGGSTPRGYQRSAAAWLHWRIMNLFADTGRAVYNLGGAPAAAVEPGHCSHGLHRFKAGFGSRMVDCQGASWVFRRTHARLHQVLHQLRSHIPSSARA